MFFSLISLCACRTTQPLGIEPVQLTGYFSLNGQQPLVDSWWQQFNNQQLNNLISQGLHNNLSLSARKLRLKSSAITTSNKAAAQYPVLSLTASGSSDIDKLQGIDSAAVGLSASWELDLWGKLAAEEQQAYWQHIGRQQDYKTRATLVAGSITNAWLGRVTELEKQALLATQHQRIKDALRVITRRFSMGKNSASNVWQQESLLKSIEVLQARNQADLALYNQTLALWLGLSPQQLSLSQIAKMPPLPPLPNLGIPAQALMQRPDIQKAYAQVQAANQGLALAMANRWPRLSIRANYNSNKSNSQTLLDNWAGNLLASLTAPLFDAGLKANVVQQRKLELEALIFDFQHVWLEAIYAVNKTLINETQLLAEVANVQLQIELADKTQHLTTLKYLNGKTNYINLLRAQESVLRLERQRIEAKRRLLANRVLLYREVTHADFSLAAHQQRTNDKQNHQQVSI